jgi:hypothetical protein
MTVPVVYRTTSPGVLVAWTAANTALDTYIDRTHAILEAAGLGDYQVWRGKDPASAGHVAGIEIPEGTKPPGGWSISPAPADSEYRLMATPGRYSAAGRDIDDALRAVPNPGWPLPRLPGMPPTVEWCIYPDIRLLGNGTALYAKWPVAPEGKRSWFVEGPIHVNLGFWEQVSLALYRAELERADLEDRHPGDTDPGAGRRHRRHRGASGRDRGRHC